MANEIAKFNLFSAHFPKSASKKIQNYATNQVMHWSRYLFTRRVGKKQYAYCTHCRMESETKGLKIKQVVKCPSCGMSALVKGSGMSRKSMFDEAYLLFYEKSKVDKNAIIARGFYITRDYRKSYHDVETNLKLTAMYLFKPGHSEMWSRNYYSSQSFKQDASIRSQSISEMKYKLCYHSLASIKAAVKGTPFQYCTWEYYSDYGFDDRLKVFDLAAKYPCIEYLTKLGLSPIVVAKLSGQQTYGAINWRGRSIEKVLRLTKSEAKEWVKLPYKSGLLSLYAYQFFNKKLNMSFSFDQAHQLCGLAEKQAFHDVAVLINYAPLKSILLYILRQINRKASNHYRGYSAHAVLRDWGDYLKECGELGMDLKQDYILFPSDLHEAHQKTMSKVKIKRNEIVAAEIIERATQLKEYTFEHAGLVIRPAASSDELFKEGKALNHCVGSYAERYAKGHCDIYVIRKVEKPDKPFFTMEIRNGHIAQCRGFKNCSATKEVQELVDLFKAKKLDKKRVKVGIAV